MPTKGSQGAQNAQTLGSNDSLASENAQFKILVVDGNQFFTPFVEKFLEAEGHQVMKAFSADEALAMTSESQPDLILFDNGVEGSAGRDMLSDLLVAQNSAAVVVLARNPTVSASAEAIRRGAVDYQEALDVQKLKEIIEFQKSAAF
jgi:DNA-binding NtrC family response regulator